MWMYRMWNKTEVQVTRRGQRRNASPAPLWCKRCWGWSRRREAGSQQTVIFAGLLRRRTCVYCNDPNMTKKHRVAAFTTCCNSFSWGPGVTDVGRKVANTCLTPATGLGFRGLISPFTCIRVFCVGFFAFYSQLVALMCFRIWVTFLYKDWFTKIAAKSTVAAHSALGLGAFCSTSTFELIQLTCFLNPWVH